jgi:hypothetical protein
VAGPLGIGSAAIAFGVDAVYEDELSTLRIPRVPWLRDASAVVVYDRAGSVSYVEIGTPSVEVREGTNLADEPRDDLVLRGDAGAGLSAAPPMPAAREIGVVARRSGGRRG